MSSLHDTFSFKLLPPEINAASRSAMPVKIVMDMTTSTTNPTTISVLAPDAEAVTSEACCTASVKFGLIERAERKKNQHQQTAGEECDETSH
jgi:hypothetical protein